MIIYELDNKPIPELYIESWKQYCHNAEDLILISDQNLSYLQGVRDAVGLNCVIIGSNGAEIQLGKEIPRYTGMNSVWEVIAKLKEDNGVE